MYVTYTYSKLIWCILRCYDIFKAYWTNLHSIIVCGWWLKSLNIASLFAWGLVSAVYPVPLPETVEIGFEGKPTAWKWWKLVMVAAKLMRRKRILILKRLIVAVNQNPSHSKQRSRLWMWVNATVFQAVALCFCGGIYRRKRFIHSCYLLCLLSAVK